MCTLLNLFVALFSLAVIYVVSVQKEYAPPYEALLITGGERFFDLTDARRNFFDGENEFSATKKKQFAHRRIPRAQARKREDTHTHQDENGQRGSRGVINIPRISDDQE